MTATDLRTNRLTARALLAVAALVATALGAYGAADPWEDGFRGVNAAAYHAQYVKHHLRLGLARTRGGSVGLDEPLADGRLNFTINHPAMYPLLHTAVCAVFGLSELAMRLCQLALFLPAVGAVYFLGRRCGGPLTGGIAAIAFASLPLAAYYGPMVAADGAVLAAGPWAVEMFLRFLDRPSRARLAAATAVFTFACLLDWSGFYFGPVCAAIAAIRGDFRRAIPALATLFGGAVVSLAAYFVHGAMLFDGLRPFLDAVGVAFRHTEGGGARPEVAALWSNVGAYTVRWCTPALLALAVLGIIRSAFGSREGRRAAALALTLVAPGVIHVAWLPNHAIFHDFWPMHATPGLALLIAFSVRPPDGRPRPRATRIAFVVVFAAAAAWGVARTFREVSAMRTDRHRLVGEALAALIEPGDVFTAPEDLAVAAYYADGLVIWNIDDAEKARLVMERYRPPSGAARRIILTLPIEHEGDALDAAFAALAPRQKLYGRLAYVWER